MHGLPQHIVFGVGVAADDLEFLPLFAGGHALQGLDDEHAGSGAVVLFVFDGIVLALGQLFAVQSHDFIRRQRLARVFLRGNFGNFRLGQILGDHGHPSAVIALGADFVVAVVRGRSVEILARLRHMRRAAADFLFADAAFLVVALGPIVDPGGSTVVEAKLHSVIVFTFAAFIHDHSVMAFDGFRGLEVVGFHFANELFAVRAVFLVHGLPQHIVFGVGVLAGIAAAAHRDFHGIAVQGTIAPFVGFMLAFRLDNDVNRLPILGLFIIREILLVAADFHGAGGFIHGNVSLGAVQRVDPQEGINDAFDRHIAHGARNRILRQKIGLEVAGIHVLGCKGNGERALFRVVGRLGDDRRGIAADRLDGGRSHFYIALVAVSVTVIILAGFVREKLRPACTFQCVNVRAGLASVIREVAK